MSFSQHKNQPVEDMLAELSELNLEFFEKLFHPEPAERPAKLLQSAELLYREIRESLKTAFITQIEREDYLLIAQFSVRTAYNVEDSRMAMKQVLPDAHLYDQLLRLLQQLYLCIHDCMKRLQDFKKTEFEKKLQTAVTENRRIHIEWRHKEGQLFKENPDFLRFPIYQRFFSTLHLLESFVYALETVWLKNI